jgi:hypothetical protein
LEDRRPVRPPFGLGSGEEESEAQAVSGATIYFIRHAEKPDAALGTAGTDEQGNADDRSLTPRGWQRAGALAVWLMDPQNVKPIERVYAARPEGRHDDEGGGSKSKRPLETVTPFAERARLEVVTRYTKGGELQLGEELAGLSGVTLVSWQHENLRAIVLAVSPNVKGVPATWPDDRFDVVWVLERVDGAAWRFTEIPQMVLDGDKEKPIHA